MPFCTTLPRAPRYTQACRTLFVGPSLRCDGSIRNGAELSGSVYYSNQYVCCQTHDKALTISIGKHFYFSPGKISCQGLTFFTKYQVHNETSKNEMKKTPLTLSGNKNLRSFYQGNVKRWCDESKV